MRTALVSLMLILIGHCSSWAEVCDESVLGYNKEMLKVFRGSTQRTLEEGGNITLLCMKLDEHIKMIGVALIEAKACQELGGYKGLLENELEEAKLAHKRLGC